MIKIYDCTRCGHQWASRMDPPVRCAKCKTPYWNTPKPHVVDLSQITDPGAARRKLAHEILFPSEPHQDNAAAELRSTAAARSDQHPQNAEKGQTIND